MRESTEEPGTSARISADACSCAWQPSQKIDTARFQFESSIELSEYRSSDIQTPINHGGRPAKWAAIQIESPTKVRKAHLWHYRLVK